MRLLQLDSMRFFALLIIVISHFEFLTKSSIGNVFSTYLQNPILAVDYFFLLSGFGLFYSGFSKNIPHSIFDSIKYAFAKIKKIYPLYIISLLISIPNLVFIRNGDLENICIKFLVDLTLCQSFFGVSQLSHGINGVCWFLSTLFLCYILAPKMIFFIKKRCENLKASVLSLASTILIILFLSFFLNEIQNRFPFLDDLVYGSVYVRGFYLFLGMLLANIVLQTKTLKHASCVELLTFLMSVFWFFFRNSLLFSLNNNFLMLLPIDLIVVMSCFSFAYGQGFLSKKLKDNKFLVKWGGAYGMYIYLLHYPVRMTVDGVFLKLNLGTNMNIMLVEICLILLSTVVLSVLLKFSMKRLPLTQKVSN